MNALHVLRHMDLKRVCSLRVKEPPAMFYQGAGSHTQAEVLWPRQRRNWVLCSPERQHTDPHLNISTGFLQKYTIHLCIEGSLVQACDRKNAVCAFESQVVSQSPHDGKTRDVIFEEIFRSG